MKPTRASGTLGLLIVAGIAGPCALANESGWYVGANVGQSRASIDEERIIGGLLGAGFTTTSFEEDDRDLGYKVFGGYQFSRYFALEGGYFDLGEFDFTATTAPPGTLRGNIKLKGVNLDVLGILPFTDRFSAFARIGANYAEAKDRFRGSGAVIVSDPNRSKRDTNYKFGLGLEYDFAEFWSLRTEAERYRIDDAVGNKGDVDLFSLGLVYRFFGKTPAPVPLAVAPEPVAAPAPPPPVFVPPPPPRPMPKRVTFSADSLFDFDKATVKPEGKQELDKFAADLRGTRFEVITVTGHTDRIGTHAYNMELSTRRAEAVKTYLVESAGIPAGKIAASGTDGSDPVTKPGECTGREKPRASRELIACLQPDRRVEVEVSGTR